MNYEGAKTGSWSRKYGAVTVDPGAARLVGKSPPTLYLVSSACELLFRRVSIVSRN